MANLCHACWEKRGYPSWRPLEARPYRSAQYKVRKVKKKAALNEKLQEAGKPPIK
jgi:hypothetical protein